MLRIYFTDEDIARTRLAPGPHVLWELLLSVHALQAAQSEFRLWLWRQRAQRRLPTAYTRRLFEIAPPRGYSPDFLTPTTGPITLDEGLALVQSTDRGRIESDMGELFAHRPVTRWLQDVARADTYALRQLGDVMHHYHAAVIKPYWTSIRAAVAADRSTRLEKLATGGVETLLATLHPKVRWVRPVLEVPALPDSNVHLEGQGLLIQPVVFSDGRPTKLRSPDLPPVLVVPVASTPWDLTVEDEVDTEQALASLLGRTRARALAAIADGCTTSELARRCGISLGAASQQAAVLRRAGLITTRRDGGSVIHEIAALGLTLLSTPVV